MLTHPFFLNSETQPHLQEFLTLTDRKNLALVCTDLREYRPTGLVAPLITTVIDSIHCTLTQVQLYLSDCYLHSNIFLPFLQRQAPHLIELQLVSNWFPEKQGCDHPPPGTYNSELVTLLQFQLYPQMTRLQRLKTRVPLLPGSGKHLRYLYLKDIEWAVTYLPPQLETLILKRVKKVRAPCPPQLTTLQLLDQEYPSGWGALSTSLTNLHLTTDWPTTQTPDQFTQLQELGIPFNHLPDWETQTTLQRLTLYPETDLDVALQMASRSNPLPPQVRHLDTSEMVNSSPFNLIFEIESLTRLQSWTGMYEMFLEGSTRMISLPRLTQVTLKYSFETWSYLTPHLQMLTLKGAEDEYSSHKQDQYERILQRLNPEQIRSHGSFMSLVLPPKTHTLHLSHSICRTSQSGWSNLRKIILESSDVKVQVPRPKSEILGTLLGAGVMMAGLRMSSLVSRYSLWGLGSSILAFCWTRSKALRPLLQSGIELVKIGDSYVIPFCAEH